MKLRCILVILSTAILVAVPFRQTGATASTGAVFHPADDLKPMLKLKLWDLNGKAFKTDKLKGSIVVLDFWATWCRPCIAEIPRLNDLEQTFSGKGVKVVGVAMASGTGAEVKPLVGRHNVKYTILMGDDDQTYDLNIVGYPTTYLVTRDWKVFDQYVGGGPVKIQRIESDIKKLLQAEADSSR
ncbi:MAG TPA: TlpA disulfide reductase family protein [Blastocatellia bacterium]|nr:TlpA disulfide reductase family protein [Blastocatellia bacterium]